MHVHISWTENYDFLMYKNMKIYLCKVQKYIHVWSMKNFSQTIILYKTNDVKIYWFQTFSNKNGENIPVSNVTLNVISLVYL